MPLPAWLAAIRAGIAPYLLIVRLLPGVSGTLSASVACAVVVGAALPVAFTVSAGWLVGTVPAAVAAGL